MLRPFDARYYISKNRLRTIVLIILISMIAICYVGGLYIASPFYEELNTIDVYKNFAVVILKKYGSVREYTELSAFVADKTSGIGQHIPVRYYTEAENISSAQFYITNQYMFFKTLIGVPGGAPMPVFLNPEDFATFNDLIKLMPEGTILDDGKLVMSEIFRINMNLEIGDIVENDYEMVVGFNQSCELADTYIAKGYTYFRVDSTYTADSVMLLRENIYDTAVSIDNFNRALKQVKERFPSFQIIDYQQRKEIVYEKFSAFRTILFIISLVVALVLAVTINAIFAGEYEKRKFEFSLYKAIGFSLREITVKVIKEIFMIQSMGVMLGILLALITVFCLNRFVLPNQGLKLAYYSIEAVIGTLLCAMIILITLISVQIIRVKKCDVTNF